MVRERRTAFEEFGAHVVGELPAGAPADSQDWFEVSGRFAVGALFLLLTTRQARDVTISLPLGEKAPRD